jgi:hypothetical protein
VAIAVKVAVNIVRMGLILRRVLLLKKRVNVLMCQCANVLIRQYANLPMC